MKELRTEIRIEATPDAVWRVLCEFDQYGAWNPFIHEAVGVCAVGERLTLRAGPIQGRTFPFRPRVLVAEPGRELRWLGSFGVRCLFDGEHIFELEQVNGGVKVVHRESFRGILVPLLFNWLAPDTHAGFERMNDALRRRAEGRRQESER
jgi:hypothetical protein